MFQSPERPDLDAQPRAVGDSRDFPRVGNPFPPNCKQADGAGNGRPEAQVIGEPRVWGGVPMSMIKGRVTLIWWSRHLSRLGVVR